MKTPPAHPRQHGHSFGQEHVRPGERRTLIVVILTAVMMVGEIITGLLFGSMALLADGLHMASHTVALGLALFAYVYARRRAHDERFSFGTGKVNALGGFSGALLLAIFALSMAWASFDRFLHPVHIRLDEAIFVASLGLVVNIVSALLLSARPPAAREGGGAEHEHDAVHHHGHSHDHGHGHSHEHDHNLRSAYLHVMADALTSVGAIVALLAAKYFGLSWMDPAMGIVGSLLVSVWAWSLLRSSSRVLLDHQAPAQVLAGVRSALEEGASARVVDLHVWSIGPGLWSAAVSVVAAEPRAPDDYKAFIPASLRVVHVTIEVHPER